MLTQGLKNLPHLLVGLGLLAVRPDDEVGKGGLFRSRLLGRHDLASACLAEAAADQPLQLKVVGDRS